MMRKTCVLLGLLLAVLMVSSCVSAPTNAATEAANAPDWYLNPPVSKDAMYGVGTAKLTGLDMSRTMALSRARDDVARQIQVLVKNAVKDYAQVAGSGEDTQTLQFSENVSLQVSNQTLKGVRTEKVSVGQDGTVFALVSITTLSLRDEAKQAFQRNEAAAFANYKADEAVDFLNKEIEKSSQQGK